ncbi:MAG: type II secretion system F family protein [Ruminococcaceae bacterium]|nr:type II secretion system F family protein [Oscillospiraceae bacterium]
MPTYKYVAVNLQKKKYKGIFIAEDEKDLAVQLTKQNLYLVSASLYKGGTPSAFFTLGTGKVKLSELTTFCRQFSIMISTGIPLLGCIDSLKQQPYSGYFKSILQVISEDLKGGAMLSESLDKHKKVFPDFFRSMVHVGEASGKLDSVFISLADYYESDAKIKRKVKGALAYPLMLAMMTLGIVIIMLAFVVPTFRETLSTLDVKPEGITLAVYNVSDFILNWWQLLVAGAIILGGGIFLFSRTKTGKKVFDIIKIKCPLIGRIQINLITARFARAFSLLLESGMDLATALDTISIILGNSYIEERFNEAAEDVRHGVSLTNAFQKQNLFPQMLLQMISVGEKTASLEEVLGRSCVFFDEQVESSLSSLTSKIQPTMLIIMGVVIGTLFIAVYSPMLSIMNGLG